MWTKELRNDSWSWNIKPLCHPVSMTVVETFMHEASLHASGKMLVP